MCLDVFIGSKNKLPTIAWIKDQPGLTIREVSVTETIDYIGKILQSEFLYNVGSHMGCSCGLLYGEWSKNDEEENHAARVRDVKKLMLYLKQHKVGNELKLFCTNWDEFPEEYNTRIFDFDSVKENEFEFIMETILLI